ncbi:MAG TPA: TIM barrel protein [Candidatus Borkfalkia excrementavium]|uniref:TIM barrel protein n=1 Tax=Candidatus Borkfalkia excrementavium TaxID=2838505 RepID=A0A9D2CG00_9FIRM|nr:TIM barrel protein [Candidatus Borkfalkia excrementavium]
MIKFGPSGNSESFYAQGYAHTEQAAKYVKEMGLDCFEYSFGRGVRMTEAKAISIGEAFRNEGIEISVHAPYYINFANPSDENAAKSYGYVLDSGKALKLMGGRRCVFHAATQGKMERAEAVSLTEERLKILRDYIYLNGLQDLMFCPETMGKLAQIGTLEEVVRFCKIDQIFVPAVDFGHLNAREQGSLKTVSDYRSRLEYMISELGYDRVKHFHVHFSKIEYSAKGEVRHLTFEDTVYGPEFGPLAIALKELKLEPFIVSESAGTQAEDALAMKKIYEAV